VLLDEPLANLDYKLREELRAELPKIFAETGAIFVYATTEPHEALLLGGNTATLSEGRITQFGPTIEVFRAARPRHRADLRRSAAQHDRSLTRRARISSSTAG
jgi:ABC-type sugar transport system ATPase subunit